MSLSPLTMGIGPVGVGMWWRRILKSTRGVFQLLCNQCIPWFALATASLKLLFASEEERSYVRVRYFTSVTKIDFASVYSFIGDLL